MGRTAKSRSGSRSELGSHSGYTRSGSCAGLRRRSVRSRGYSKTGSDYKTGSGYTRTGFGYSGSGYSTTGTVCSQRSDLESGLLNRIMGQHPIHPPPQQKSSCCCITTAILTTVGATALILLGLWWGGYIFQDTTGGQDQKNSVSSNVSTSGKNVPNSVKKVVQRPKPRAPKITPSTTLLPHQKMKLAKGLIPYPQMTKLSVYCQRCYRMLELQRKRGFSEWEGIKKRLAKKLDMRFVLEKNGHLKNKKQYSNFMARGCLLCNWTGEGSTLTDAARLESVKKFVSSNLAKNWQ